MCVVPVKNNIRKGEGTGSADGCCGKLEQRG